MGVGQLDSFVHWLPLPKPLVVFTAFPLSKLESDEW
jgi:hypothetical protein